MCVHVHVFLYVCVRVCMCVCLSLCLHVCASVHVCPCLYMFVHTSMLFLLSLFTTDHYYNNIGAPFLCTEGKEGYLSHDCLLYILLLQYSMKFNCVPNTKPFHAARRNFTFLFLIPIGYSFTRYVKVIIDHSNQP